MTDTRYSPNVRLGNWNEELFLKEEKLKLFLKKRERRELLVQNARELFGNLLKEVTLAMPMEYVTMGSVVQLVSPEMPSGRNSQKKGIALSTLVGEKEVDIIRHLVEGCVLTGSPLLTPCVRNAFVITSVDESSQNGAPLRYGDNFQLCPVETLSDKPLYVRSESQQINAVLGSGGYMPLTLSSISDTYTRWRCLYWRKTCRPETEGGPVPPHCKIVINHAASNKNLAVERHEWFPTYFGMECQVSVHSFKDIYRQETAPNMWELVTHKS